MKSIKNKECGGIVKNLIPLKKEIEELIDEFNDFIKKWCGNSYPHLIDSDENDGEVFRDNIKLLFACSKIFPVLPANFFSGLQQEHYFPK